MNFTSGVQGRLQLHEIAQYLDGRNKIDGLRRQEKYNIENNLGGL